MVKIRWVIVLVLVSNVLFGQKSDAIVPFNKKLNTFYNVRDFCISNSGNEAFFTIQSPDAQISQIAVVKKEKKEWLEPELLAFNDSFMYLEPFLSSNGNRLFFVSDRPLDNTSSEKKDFDIWYVDRNNSNDTWSAPKNIGEPINSTFNEFYPSVSRNNNLYFTMEAPNGLGKDDIYFSKWNAGSYEAPVLLDENINSSGYEFNAFISREEKFIVYTKYNEDGGQGSGDLYISRKDENGKWGKAKNLGVPINTKYMEYCPFYDAENQILYFTSKRRNLEPRKFKDILDFKSYVQENPNGLSRIYSTSIKIE
ncbi:MAG: PD40 domain-containing protein [Oceanihabitans sp.]|nr:PD40 domain-containing protein [Oceanihabitans sp.]